MSTNITAVLSFFQSYFQSLLDPNKLPMTLGGFAIGIGIGEFARRMIAQWKAKDRLITQLRADNDIQQRQIASLRQAVIEEGDDQDRIEAIRDQYRPTDGV